MTRPLRLALAVTAATATATAAPAATFTTRDAFEANVLGGYAEDFESLPRGVIGFDGPAVLPSGLRVESRSNELYVVAPRRSRNPTRAIGSNQPVEDHLDFVLGGSFRAFGADIFQNLPRVRQADRPIGYTISAAYLGNLVETVTGRIGPDGGFLGFVADRPFTAVRVASSELPAFEVVDNVRVADSGLEPSPAPIPLPAGLPLLAGAMAALGLARRARR